MATIQITVPDTIVTRLQDAFAATYGYQPTINGAANPETLPAFTRRMLRDHARNVLVSYEAQQAGETAREAAETKAITDVG